MTKATMTPQTPGEARYVSRGDEPAAQGHSEADFPADPSQRQPKGDHNRRLALFLEPDAFAAEAGISVEELRDYERTPPDGTFDTDVARRVGEALDRLEAATPADKRVIS